MPKFTNKPTYHNLILMLLLFILPKNCIFIIYTKRLPDAPYNVYNKFTESIISKRTKTISDLVLKNNSSR